MRPFSKLYPRSSVCFWLVSQFGQSIWQEKIHPLSRKIFTDLGDLPIAIALIAISLVFEAPSYAQPNRVCPSQLQQEVEKISRSPNLKTARTGVFIQTSEPNPKVLVNLDGDHYFIPASNTKLFTTAIALKVLGADYRFTTKLVSQSLPNAQGELEGELWLVASGDPSFRSDTSLKSLVTQLKNRGVKRIKGGLGMLSNRKGAEISGSWEWQDLQESYAAIASPFTIDENVVNWSVRPSQIGQPAIFEWENPVLASQWRIENQTVTIDAVPENQLSDYSLQVTRPYGQKLLILSGQVPINSKADPDAVSVPDPEESFLSLLRQELQNQGIELSDTVGNLAKPSTSATKTYAKRLNFSQSKPLQDLAISLSPPLSQLVSTTNKNSNNLYAELLLRALGDRYYAITPDDSVSGGMFAINKYLQSVNIAPNLVSLADGSGLSRQNLTTPIAIVQFLQSLAMDQDFRKSLPIAGVDGTLLRRFKDSDAQGLIQAKTGSLTGAAALSGYVRPPKYRELIFSIIINNSNLSGKELQQHIDAIALLITHLEDCR
ncbi:D-alanyl-D-alanine carboxypeptidase/D-alanyl-D-alanine-endopeptidase [Pseudanabaena sp. FACHB-1998]|uniref:D-alanyl-D-alanine carboxypeptidase/D-alanyl-D-alanine endopeptidase n=1 Tax=Pseudanabaena sp. FACHB-1998 TaxID=2692858 RepID=UPI0016812B98|nr:D-alanyl-D-alanine carboxypeptidase/D-alanyl-D-alanine-endopeptidase [Pseudanabaena sp. FACHB-1998]MBD2178277.1 D-alanyl-D-alanine carboxypeptidase/D-alanyl-D-alanine-endopeptidase [Pseudanabaena sp. FACHB-1998]